MDIRIFSSLLGAISDPDCWPEFSCIKKDGSLDSWKYSEFISASRLYGADATRELPYLVYHKGQQDNLDYMDSDYMPYKTKDEGIPNQVSPIYDLDNFNHLYFENLRNMAEIANFYGIQFFFSLFDRCHGTLGALSPWIRNAQGIETWYGDNAAKYRYEWIAKVLETLKGLWVGFELENEPFDSRFAAVGAETYRQLRAAGVEHKDIITGVDYLAFEGKGYERLKKTLRKDGNYHKSEQYRTIHNISEEKCLLYRHTQRHTGRYFWSDDGVNPKRSADWFEKNLTEFFSYRPPKRNKAFQNVWGFEHVYRYPDSDHLNGVDGIRRAFQNVTGIDKRNQPGKPGVTIPVLNKLYY